MDNHWQVFYEKLNEVSRLTRLAAYWTNECARKTEETAYYAKETAIYIKKALKDLE